MRLTDWLRNDTVEAVESAKFKGVTCRQCGQQYAYFVRCAGVGQAAGYLGIENDGAPAAAQTRAREDLQRALDNWTAPAPCPRCGLLQPEMIADARRRILRRLALPGLAILLVAVGALLVVWEQLAALAILCIVLATVGKYWPRSSSSWTGDSSRQRHPTWTRQELEAKAQADPDLNIVDALLDWERQRISHE